MGTRATSRVRQDEKTFSDWLIEVDPTQVQLTSRHPMSITDDMDRFMTNIIIIIAAKTSVRNC